MEDPQLLPNIIHVVLSSLGSGTIGNCIGIIEKELREPLISSLVGFHDEDDAQGDLSKT